MRKVTAAAGFVTKKAFLVVSGGAVGYFYTLQIGEIAGGPIRISQYSLIYVW